MPSNDCIGVDRHLHATPPKRLRDLHSRHGHQLRHIRSVLQQIHAADDENRGLGDARQQVGEGGGSQQLQDMRRIAGRKRSVRRITTCCRFTTNDPLKRPSSPTARSMNSRGTKSKRRSRSRHCLDETLPRFPQESDALLDTGSISPRESRIVLVEEEPKRAISGHRAARRRFGKHETALPPRQGVDNRGFPRTECVIESGHVTQVVTPVDGEI